MKKRFTYIMLSLAFAFVALMVSGCTEDVNKYTINVSVLHANLGSVQIVQGENGKFEEGTELTIKALPASSTSGSTAFVAWIANNKVVSNEAEYTFIVNAETDGDYVALFDSTYLEYICLDNFTVNVLGDDENNPTTNLTKVEIFMGVHENLLTKVIEYENNKVGPNFNFLREDLYTENELPFAYDMQENIYLNVVLTFMENEVEFKSTTAININGNPYVANVAANNLVEHALNKAVGDDPNLQLGAGKDIGFNISVEFDRVDTFDLNVEDEENPEVAPVDPDITE